MQCEIVRHAIADYLAGTLKPEAECDVEQHLAVCASCRQESGELKALWAEMAEVSIPAPNFAGAQERLGVLVADFRSELLEPQTVWEQLRRFCMRRPWTVAALVMAAVLVCGTAVFLSEVSKSSSAPSSRIRGLESAAVTLSEYGDYECPPCAPYNSVIVELLKKHPTWVKFEFHHFPLPMHPNAMAAAKAVEAAGTQGQYWEMHDLVLSRQQTWKQKESTSEFAKMAEEIGLDRNQFVELQKLSSGEQRIAEDMKRARELGVTGTPTFFLNGRLIQTPARTLEAFEALLEKEMSGGPVR